VLLEDERGGNAQIPAPTRHVPTLSLPSLSSDEGSDDCLKQALQDGDCEEELYLRRVALLGRDDDDTAQRQAKWNRMESQWRWQGDCAKTTIHLA